MKGFFRALAALGVVLLGGCDKPPTSIEEAIEISGCKAAHINKSENIFHGNSAKCSDGSRLYWFPTKEANQAHSVGCKSFGGLPVDSGSNWTRYKPSC
jgi:hypothetical protein